MYVNKFEHIKSTAKNINLTETISFLERVADTKRGKIISEIPTINGLEIEFTKADRCFKFSTGSIVSCGGDTPANYQGSGYGFMKPFEIIDSEITYKVREGAGLITSHIGNEFSTTGELWDLETNFSEGAGFFRVLFPIDRATKTLIPYLLGEPMVVGNSFKAAGYVSVLLDGIKLGIYDYDIKNDKYFFIESNTETEYPIFEKILESIIYSFALLSGSLIRNEVTILKFSDSNFSNYQGFQFRKVEDSIISAIELINPREHGVYEHLQKTVYFPVDTFSRLCTLCYTNKPLLRAVRIITQSRNQPIEIQAASIFVALETVKQIIINENTERITPFKDKQFASNIMDEFKTKISSLSDSLFNKKDSVLRKLNSLNQIGNNESFNSAFDLVGFKLTKVDKDYISMRNRFLHGNIPFENEPEDRKNKELRNIALSVHLLTCSLILKYAGFNGAVKDFLKYWDLRNGIPNNSKLFRHI